jgi:hypothetical protein
LANTIRGLSPTLSLSSVTAINALEQSFAAKYQAAVPKPEYARSVAHGQGGRKVFLFKPHVGCQDPVRNRLPFPGRDRVRFRGNNAPFGADHLPVHFQDSGLAEASGALEIVVTQLLHGF